METQKGPYKDYSPFEKGAIWVSMLIWGSVHPKPYYTPEALALWRLRGCGENLLRVVRKRVVLFEQKSYTPSSPLSILGIEGFGFGV